MRNIDEWLDPSKHMLVFLDVRSKSRGVIGGNSKLTTFEFDL